MFQLLVYPDGLSMALHVIMFIPIAPINLIFGRQIDGVGNGKAS